MVKKLLHYVRLADELGWPAFIGRVNYYVIVVAPEKGEDDDDDTVPTETLEYFFKEELARPDTTGDFRVGVLKKSDGSFPTCSPLVIGRGRSCDVVLPEIQVSKKHALMEIGQGGTWMIWDNESTNGTFVNDIRIPSDIKTPIKSMDTIRFGQGLNAAFFSPENFFQYLSSHHVRKSLLG